MGAAGGWAASAPARSWRRGREGGLLGEGKGRQGREGEQKVGRAPRAGGSAEGAGRGRSWRCIGAARPLCIALEAEGQRRRRGLCSAGLDSRGEPGWG